MKSKTRWQASILDAAKPAARALPWAGKTARAQWRKRCRARANQD